MASDLLLDVVNISKSFGTIMALDRVNFSVRRQEVVGLLGDNGAGKSTLVKTISGFHRPDEGEIYVEGRRAIISSPADSRKLGIETIYQDLALVDDLSVYRNIFLARELRRKYFGFLKLLDDHRMRKDAGEGLKELRIGMSSVEHPVRDLSGGQRQTVAIARAVMNDAKLFLMDEPTAALGVAESRQVLDIIRDLKQKGKSIVVIAHNTRHIIAVCDRLVILRRGRVVAGMPAKGLSVVDIENMIVENN